MHDKGTVEKFGPEKRIVHYLIKDCTGEILNIFTNFFNTAKVKKIDNVHKPLTSDLNEFF